MTFKFHCTCGQKVSATSDMIGTRATCPRCGASVKVPKPPEDPVSAPETSTFPPKETSEVSQKSSTTTPAEPSSKAPPSSQPEIPIDIKAPSDAPQKVAPAPAPVRIVPRPIGLLWTVASVFMVLTIASATFLAWGHQDRFPKTAGLALAAIVVGVILGAVLLRQFIRLFLKFDPGFSESLPITLLAASLTALAFIPAGLSLLGKIPPEEGARLLPVTIGAALLLSVTAYGFLIRNALGRPVGIGRGALAFLLQSASVGIFLAVVWGMARQFVFLG